MTRYYHSSLRLFRLFSAKIFGSLSLPLLASSLFFLNACEEDPTTIGEDLLPGNDFVTIYSTDTISVRSFTMYTDSIRSDYPKYSYVGQLYDAYFGTTTAEFVSQMRLNDTWDNDIFTIDSIKLYLSLVNVKGNTAAGHILRLSEISEEIYTDSVYYSNRSVPLAGYSFDILLPELKADTVNDLVLDIPVEFGTHITRNTSMFFHDNTKPDFRSYFKGFYFQLIPAGNPAFLTLSVAPTGTYGIYSNYFVMYLHDENDATSKFYFIFDSFTRNAAFNLYKHDYTTGEPVKRFDETINKDILDTLTYLQGLNGVYTRIKLQSLETIKNDPTLKGISINKARLVFPFWNTGTGYAKSSLPSQLLMRYTDISGIRYYVPDYNSTTNSFYDGTIDTVAGVYNFNIALFVQNYLKDTENTFKPELDLFVQTSSIQKAIMRANGNSKPVKFEFIYTKF